jgi:hypothetical protein
LTGCDLGTDEGQRLYMENNRIERCQHYVEDATSIAISLLTEAVE